MNKLSIVSTVVVTQDQVSCDLSEELAILNIKNGVYYGLDSIGTRIWKLIQSPITVGEILEELLKEYEVEPDRCEHDLVMLLERLSANGLIQMENEKITFPNQP